MLALLLACAAPGALVVVLDTTRADVVQPGILPDGARVYTHAYSAAPWTSSSVYTLTTGNYPDRPASMLPPWEAPWMPHQRLAIPRGYPVDAGLTWHDAALTDSVVAGWVLGVDTVADPFEEARDLLPHGGAIYVHDLGPHQPYEGLPMTAQDRALFDAVDVRGGTPGDVSPALGAWAWHAYHAAADDTLTRVRSLLDDAIADGWTVVLTADHGEALGESGRWGHALSLDDEQVRVPLMVWGPGVVPGVDNTLTPATCVAATVRAVLGKEPMGCDLRTGDVRGVVEVGMLRGGEWVTRRPGTDTTTEED